MNRFVRHLLVLLAMTVGCGDDGDGEVDTDVEPTGEPGTGVKPSGKKWSVEEIEADVGIHSKIAVGPSGDVSVAYYANSPFEDGECIELEHDPKPTRKRYELRFATKTGDAWSTELIDSPLSPEIPSGLAHAYSPDGEPVVVYTGGEPILDWCGANDAFYSVRSGGAWTPETAAAESGESATGNEASDAGFGVGFNPTLTFDNNGDPAIVHQDKHFVYLQRDDEYRADAELAWRTGGAWQHEAVDYAEGAGDANAIVFDESNRPIVFYAIDVESHVKSRHGVWAGRLGEDGEWEQIKIHTGAIGTGISATIDPVRNEPVVAFYSAPDYGVKVRRLIDPDAFEESGSWTSEIVHDDQFNEGDHVSLAFTSDGEPALSYHRCRRYDPSDDSCDPNDEALVFAIQKQGKWKFETVHQADNLSCGTYTSLAFGPDDTAYISFQCTKESMGEFSLVLNVADKQF